MRYKFILLTLLDPAKGLEAKIMEFELKENRDKNFEK
jgi:hypothetical protein